MNTTPFSILLATNGSEETRPGLEYGVWLSGVLGTPVTLLGVIEHPDEAAQVNHLVQETAQRLEESHVPLEIQRDEGRGSLVIARHAAAGEYLTVIGPLGRPAWRRVIQGRSFRRILERVCTPILYVREKRTSLQRMLVCLGGLQYSESLIQLCLHLATRAGSSLTLFHVVEPVTLDYPVAKEIHDHWQHILDTPTPQGMNLRQAYDLVLQSGLQVEFKVRHGNPVHEIAQEIKHGDYDLTGMGSAYSAHSLRHMYMPNVTAEIAESITSPLLAVRQGYSLVNNL